MLAAAQAANLAVRFLLELALLIAVATAAWQTAGPGPLRWAAVAAAPAAVTVAWVLVVHGERVPAPLQATGQAAALVLGVVCLARIGAADTAGVVAGLALVNAALLAAWNQ